jgi:hypothetical protein
MMTEDEIAQFIAERIAEGLTINPDTAEVRWDYAQTLDPYGITTVPEEYQQVGREFFARNPDGIWVHFGDLPREVSDKLDDMHKRELYFPAGLLWNKAP